MPANPALLLLARIGESGHVDDMVRGLDRPNHDTWILGRVHDPKMESFLRTKAASPDLVDALDGLAALGIERGMPEPLREFFRRDKEHEAEWADADHLAARKAILDGDPIGAVLKLAGLGGESLEILGLSNDPRVLEFLRKVRRDRFLGDRPLYWRAAAGLAIAGDPEAKQEFEEFLRDGRIWMLDGPTDMAILHARAHPEWADFWAKRLETNCCMAFHAYVVLAGKTPGLFPTMPIDHVVTDGGLMRRVAEAWLAKHKGSFVWSQILDGLVPSR